MKNLQKLAVILLVISFITLFITMSYMLISNQKSDIFLYIIEVSILIIVISFGAVLTIDDTKIKA